jgi:hypothetical protein
MFEIDRKSLFTKHSGRIVANMRQFLFWICYKRGMTSPEIHSYLSKYGKYNQTTILHGVRVFSKKAESDLDIVRMERKIRESISI